MRRFGAALLLTATLTGTWAAAASAQSAEGPVLTPDGRAGQSAVVVLGPADPERLSSELSSRRIRAIFVISAGELMRRPRVWSTVFGDGHLLALPVPGTAVVDSFSFRSARLLVAAVTGHESVVTWATTPTDLARQRAGSGRLVVAGPPNQMSRVTVIQDIAPADLTTTDLGVSESQLLSPSPVWEQWGGRSILAGAAFLKWLRGLGPFLFAVIVSLAAFRVAVMVPLALRQSRRRRPSPQDIPVTVLVPAYNEAAVVGATLDSIFRSTHRPIDCVLIDDGSTDGTLDAALSWARSRDVPVVTDRAVSGSLAAIRVTNAGKAAALNAGIRLTDAEIVVIVDADTLFDPEAVSRLAAHFGDPRVVAVSGNVKVGNRRGLLTRLQAVEYVVGLNIARRAFDALNSITVVPGASGAFRRSALLAAGGYQSDTLAEDADITVTLGGRGRFIRYEDQARAYTEAPENWRALLKQRFRWSYGSLQVLWKHRKEILRSRKGATGMFGLPAMFLFEVVLPLLSPVADLMFVATLLVGGVPDRVVVGYAVFTVLELLIAALAIRLDGERLSLLWVVPFQQVIYRQMIYAVIVRAVFTALHGGRVGWGKLARTGSVARG